MIPIDTTHTPPTSTPLTVSQLTGSIKKQLESSYTHVHLQGEISNFKPHSSGHLYFDLKDAQAKVPAVMFKGNQRGLVRFPKEGDQVVVKGALSVYPPHGKYQLIVKELQLQGVGALLLKFEALKKELLTRGWFDPAHKKMLPKFPKCIGVVTSPTGAVIRDIIHVLHRRFAGFHLILNPVRVQGESAAYEIARAIQDFNHHPIPDVLIVGRGGGSLEDLWPFNEEIVAKAIFESHIPIISAVGHETDITLADFVADVRAPTPSAAAEIATAEKAQSIEMLQKMRHHMAHATSHILQRYRLILDRFQNHPSLTTPYALLAEPIQRLDELKTKLNTLTRHELIKYQMTLGGYKKTLLALNPITQIQHTKQQLHQSQRRLMQSQRHLLMTQRERLKKIVVQLQALDPKNVLKRGYSILFAQKTGSVVTSAQNVSVGDSINAQLADGEINLTVQP